MRIRRHGLSEISCGIVWSLGPNDLEPAVEVALAGLKTTASRPCAAIVLAVHVI